MILWLDTATADSERGKTIADFPRKRGIAFVIWIGMALIPISVGIAAPRYWPAWGLETRNVAIAFVLTPSAGCVFWYYLLRRIPTRLVFRGDDLIVYMMLGKKVLWRSDLRAASLQVCRTKNREWGVSFQYSDGPLEWIALPSEEASEAGLNELQQWMDARS